MARGMSLSPRDVFLAARPWQWVKNAVVLLPWIFGQRVGDREATAWTWLVALAFCALASGTYLLNDVADRDADARDPLRRERAVASGRMTVRLANLLSLLSFGIGLTMLLPVALARGPGILLIGAGYAALTTTYSFAWKRVALLGASIVAFGFLLRVYAGGFAAGVVVSHWLALCTFLGAFYVALEKRAGDVRDEHGAAGATRLERLALLAGTAFVATYALYTVSERTRETFGTSWLALSAVPIALGVIRFHRIARRPGVAADPARAFLTDASLLGCVIGYATICALVLVYAAR